jgi:trans-aconitate 2-methyltransferase
MGTPWDAQSYDRTSAPQQAWAGDVLPRLEGLDPGARILDVGCGTGRVTEQLLALVPDGAVLAIDASPGMVELARERLGDRAEVRCLDVLALDLEGSVDAVFSTAALHWVRGHDVMWDRLGAALRPGGRLEVQCGGEGNIARVREVIAAAVADTAPELEGFSPWTFAGPAETEQRLLASGFEQIRCWLQERPTYPEDPAAFVRTSILAAHFERLAPERREPFARAVLERIELPLDYVRLNVSARRIGS